MEDNVTQLKSYTMLNEDEFEHETFVEASQQIPWTESEIRALETVAVALIKVGSPQGQKLLAKAELWWAIRTLESAVPS